MRGAGSRDERQSSNAGGQLNGAQLNARISRARDADELLALFAAHSASIDHIHAANLWNKLGKQRIERRQEEQLERLVQRTVDLVLSCNARALANIAHGVAKCGLRSRVVRPLYAAVAEAAVRGGLAGFTPQNLANTVWAYATAGHYHQALLAGCSRVISDSFARDPSRWGVVGRSQLHHWQLWLSLEGGAVGQQHLLSESQRKLCCDAMQGTKVTISRLQRSVAAALAAVQHGFEEEHLEPRTGYSLDLALPSSRVAVEVDGPSHFLLPDGRGVRKPNGPTLLKRRLLAAAGWRVISVPFYEWDGFATASERRTYLERLLD